MKRLLFWGLLFVSSLAYTETTKTIFNPLVKSGFDAITVLSSTTLPSGSTYYIQNNSNLQTPSGAGFNISSGTFTGSDGAHNLDFVNTDFTGFSSNHFRWYQSVFGTKTFKGQFGYLMTANKWRFSDSSSNTILDIDADTGGVDLANKGIIGFRPRDINVDTTVGFKEGYFFRCDATNESVLTIQLPQLGQITSPQVESASLMFCKVDASTNDVVFTAATGDTAPDLFGSLLSAQDQCVVLVSSVTNGTDAGFWYPALKTSKGYGSQYAIQIADGLGGVTSSNWVIYPTIIGLTNVAFGENFFATIQAGVGLGGVMAIYDPTLSFKVTFGAPDAGFSENYRFDFPPTQLGKNQVWLSTTSAHANSRVQLINTGVILDQNTLQSGSTFYVSSGTVSGQLSVNSIKWPDGTIQVTSPTASGLSGAGTATTNVLQYASTVTAVAGGTTLEKSLIGSGVGTSTFSANTFTNGFTFRVKAMGTYEQGTANVTFRLKVGTVTVGDSGSSTLGTGNKTWAFDSLITIRNTGSNGTLAAQSYFFPQTSGSDIMFGLTSNTVSFVNTTVANPIQLTAQFDVNDTTVTATNFLIDSLIVSTAVYSAVNPAKDYWWVGSGTLPLEPKSDAVAAVNITTGTFVDFLSADYDSATEECRGVNFVVPSEVDTSTDVLLSPYWLSVSTNVNNLVWKFYQNNGSVAGSTINIVGQSHTFPAARVATSTGTLVMTQYYIALSSLTWTANSMVDARLCRDGADGSDTMSGDAKLNGFRIRIPMK